MKPVRIKIFAVLIILNGIFCQEKVKLPDAANQQAFEQKALERQLSYAVTTEQRGDITASYNLYLQMIRKYDTDIRVISGFLDLSIKANRIKECELKIKEIIKKYPSPAGNIDPGNEKDSFTLKIQGFLAEFFLRTSREEQAYQIFDQIERSSSTKQFKSEIKAAAFFRSGLFLNAEKAFLSLRKDMKDETAYSNELYRIYFSTKRISKCTVELLKMNEKFDEKKVKGREIYTFNPQAELFKLFETEEFKDSVLFVVERSKKTEKNAILLSELYFNKGSYEKAFSILKDSGITKKADLLTADFAVRLYSEKKYSEAVTFFELSFRNLNSSKDEEFLKLYISSLEFSGQFEKTEKLIKESSLKDKEIMLAKLYHNNLNKFEEADQIYSRYLTNNKNYSEYWKDYIKLNLALKDFKKAKVLLSKVFNEKIIDAFSNVNFYEFKFMDAVLALCDKDLKTFQVKADLMIRDDFISDLDNDLLKFSADISAIAGDDELLDAYIEEIVHKLNPKAVMKEISLDHSKESNPEKKALILHTELYYLISTNKKNKVIELFNYIIENSLVNNNFAKMFVDYSRAQKKDEDINAVLLKFLKSSISEEIKAEVREIIREKQLS